METLTEKDLVVLAREGNEEAFEKLLNSSLPKLRTLLANQYHLQPSDLDEVVQAATIKVWRKLSLFRSESAFITWFYIILRNEAIDFSKKRGNINAHEVSAHRTFTDDVEDNDYEHLTAEQTLEETSATLLERKELSIAYRQLIEQVLKELSPTHSQIIQMALEEGKTYKEIATELNVPIGTVMSRLFFARKKAQQLIIQYAKRYALQLDGVGQCE